MNKLLKSCPEFVAKSELFHRHNAGKHAQPEYEKLKKVSRGVVTDAESFRAWRRHHPAETLEALHDAWQSKIIAFKLFPNHLSHELIETQLLSRTDMAFAVLRRRPVECFISTIKAKQVGIFRRTDTTDIKPELSAEEFLEWARKMRSWFKWVRQSLEARKIPFAEIGFEAHLSGLAGPETIGHMRELFRPLGIPDITLPDDVLEGTRQDMEPDYKSRVTNWDAFATQLRASPKTANTLNWAERVF